jgi:type IV secretory pathway TrbF-like protein
MIHEQGRDSFLQRAASQMPPGWSAVVAEVAEFGECRLETRMGAIGGLVFRDARSEVEDQAVHRDLRGIRTLIGEAWSEYEMAVAQATAAREAHLDEARTKLAESAPRLKLLEAYMQAQMEARVAQLRQQAEQADPERRAELECQIAQVVGDHSQRHARLGEAWNQAEGALAR